MMLARLSPMELAAVNAVIDGPAAAGGQVLDTLAPDLAKAFGRAVRKLRWGTRNGRHLVLEGVIDYKPDWFAAHPDRGRALLKRYQAACDEAWAMYWNVRRGD